MTIDQNSSQVLRSDGPRVQQHYMMNSLKLFDAKVSINHWQLRNCITADTRSPGSVYYIFDHSIRSLDTRSYNCEDAKRKRRYSTSVGQNPYTNDYHAASKQVVEFPFKPRSFNERSGLIVCGGHIGNDDNGYIPSRPITSYDQSFSAQDDRLADVDCVKIANANILSDHTAYSNTRSWKGIVSLHNRNTNISMSCKLGQYINNCVELYEPSNGQFDLYTCNNDGHLYQCEINNREFTLKRRFADLKFALNNTAISHDGKIMCVTGDSNKIALYKKNELADVFSLNYDTLSGAFSEKSGSNTTYVHKRIPRYALPDNSSYVDHIYELPEADNGFFTSFSENDMMMATVFQNGNCYVYDVRNMDQPLSEIHTTRYQGSVPQSGAFRICKFSEEMEDLLFISEHQQRVHVIDTRNFMNRQVIMVPYKYKGSDLCRNQEDVPSPYESTNWSDSSISNERRSSEPFTDDPYITMATRVPIQHLQPTILPYSSVLDPGFDHDGLNEFELTNEADEDEDDDIEAINNHLWDNSDTQGSERIDTSRSQGTRRGSNFTVRRYSTSDRVIAGESSQPIANIDPTIMGNADLTLENLSTEFPNFPPSEQTLRQRYDDNATASIPVMRPFQISSRLMRRRPRNLTPGRSAHDSIPDREECNISGIEWLRDREGSSLVIGTDYGIIKWNINYWARRSFPSYDFC